MQGAGQWYGGPGRTPRSHAVFRVRGACSHRRCAVRWGPDGLVGRPAPNGHPDRPLAANSGSVILCAMVLVTPHRRAPRFGTLVGGSIFGSLLTAAGLEMAFLVLATPFTSLVSGNELSGVGRGPIGLGIMSLGLIGAAALLLAGTNRLAVTLAALKTENGQRGPGALALASMPDEVILVRDVVPMEGRPIPEVAIGPFGAAVIHALPSSRNVRQVGGVWESRTRDGWLRTENPIDLAVRDAERVRRWFGMADLDFVVRVYATLVVTDQSVPRSPSCAVVTADQLPAWIAALPRQRSLTAARRLRLRALAAPATTPGPASIPGTVSSPGEW